MNILSGDSRKPPGIVIHHRLASTRQYVGSASLAVLPDGSYVASHDYFGPGTAEHERGDTYIYRSEDRGLTWQQVAHLNPAFWSGLFVHQGRLYLLGTTFHHGQIAIRRSDDGGVTWTHPADAESGLITEIGQYHTAPMPVVTHNGRLWRAMEDASGGTKWGIRYSPMMISAPVDADLLLRSSWTLSEKLPHDRAWLGDGFGGWLEGNAVVTPEGRVVDILRVEHTPGDTAAMVEVSPDGKSLSFDPATDFIALPGAATKFTIRHDAVSGYYWALVNEALPAFRTRPAAKIRNNLSLARSSDLRNWEVRATLLHHPDILMHGFQYVDWQFDGEDIVAAVRIAFDDEAEGARSFHDANYLSFYRVAGFRDLVAR